MKNPVTEAKYLPSAFIQINYNYVSIYLFGKYNNFFIKYDVVYTKQPIESQTSSTYKGLMIAAIINFANESQTSRSHK